MKVFVQKSDTSYFIVSLAKNLKRNNLNIAEIALLARSEEVKGTNHNFYF